MKEFLERIGFGVCRYWAGILNISASRVRLYFIYLSFIALGSPLFIYLVSAFWLNIKKYIRNSWNVLRA